MMSAPAPGPKLPFQPHAVVLALVALSGLVLLAIALTVDPAGAMRAVLLAWLVWLGVAMGSAVWLAIHGATGGRWGDAARPCLVCSARALPILALLFAGIALGARQLYPWASDTSHVIRPAVAALYLNLPAYVLRGVVILALWWWISAVVTRPLPASPRLSGICLAVYGLTVTIAAVDWSMSLAPRWTSTAFAALFALTQLTSALAILALWRPAGIASETSTLAQLLLACILGVTYLAFMQFLVIWSGNLPDKVAWYVERGSTWTSVVTAAFLGGAVLPFFLLLRARDRASSAILRLAGAATFVGILLLDIWQIGPGIGASWWVLPAVPATIGVLWLSLAWRPAPMHLAARISHGA